MLMRAYFADRGEDDQRRQIVIPDTAHGTNPASVTMAGYELVQCATDPRGNIDLDDLRGKVDEPTAGLMLTNPSTLGLFDEGIEEIDADLPRRRRPHLLRRREPERRLRHRPPRRHGLRHRPHQPPQDVLAAARRRRPGRRADRGPRRARAVPARASGRPRRRSLPLDYDRPKSIGKVRGFTGPFGVFVRSYAYIRVVRARAARDVRARRPQRQLPAGAAPRRVRPPVRPALHARVRPLCRERSSASTASPRSTSPSG